MVTQWYNLGLLSFSLYGDETLGLCETATQIEAASYPGLLTPAFVACNTNTLASYPGLLTPVFVACNTNTLASYPGLLTQRLSLAVLTH